MTFPPASEIGVTIDLLFAALTVLSSGVVLLLITLVLTFCIRYRARPGAPAPHAPAHVVGIEVVWIGATLLAFLLIAALANVVFYRSRAVPDDPYTVYVIGKRWMWKIEHPSGRREINELHVPVGEPVRLVLASDDVIHSFYVPAFRLKQDVVPGRYTSLWFTPSRAGVYHLFCAEYCGSEHSGMIGRVVALDAPDFSRWLADRPAQPPVPGMPGTPGAPIDRGRELFHRVGCAACHTQTASVFAPRLDGIWGRPTKLSTGRLVTVDENYIRESILDPNARIVAGYPSPSLMPSYQGTLSEDEVAELVQYIRSIRFGWDQAPGPTPQ